MFGMSQREKNRAIYDALDNSFVPEKLVKALKKGGDPNVEWDSYYVSPLFRSTGFYKDESVAQAFELLVKAGALLEKKDGDGATVLIKLVARNPSYTIALKKLIELGSDIHAEDNYGRTPLYRAIEHSGWHTALILMEAGGDLKTQSSFDKTILMEAMEKDAPLNVVGCILQSKVDINAATAKQPAALHIAVAKNSQLYLGLLLDRKEVFLDTRDASGRTPLMAAVSGGKREMVVSLLAKKASIDLGEDNGYTPLACAAAQGNQEILEILIKGSAALDLPDGRGLTALAYAAKSGNIRMVMTLLASAEEQGVKLALDAALLGASEKGHGRVLELLIAAGADVNVTDKEGRTPIMRAVLSDQIETLGILVKAGAKPETTDNHGLSAYDHAVTAGKGNAKGYLSRYRNEAPKGADHPAAPVVTANGYSFSRLNDHSLEVREGDGLTMTFNFWTQQVIFRDIERPAPVTVQNFSELQRQDAVIEAYEKLKELGGNPPDPRISSVQKKNLGLTKP